MTTQPFSADDMQRKIMALLAKAESTDNTHEAEAFTAKATQLMLKWGIDQAVLDLKRKPAEREQVIIVDMPVTGIYRKAWMMMANEVMHGLGMRLIYSERGNTITCKLVGHKSDIERAQMLITSLMLQAGTAQRRWWKSYPDAKSFTPMESFKARRQFIISFGSEVGKRLRAQRADVVKKTGHGAELVVRDRSQEVQDFMDAMHTRTSRSRMRGSWAGRDEGRAAGRNADLGGSKVGGNTRKGIER